MCGWVGGGHCIYVQLTCDVYLHQALTKVCILCMSVHKPKEDLRNQGEGGTHSPLPPPPPSPSSYARDIYSDKHVFVHVHM